MSNDAMAVPLIVVEGLNKSYSSTAGLATHVLKDVSVTISRGEFTAIMGPSGSGKSTFMNIVGCLDAFDSGLYRLEGVDVGTLGEDQLASVRNRTFGFVFQSFNLLPRRSIMDNVALPMIIGGQERRSANDRAHELLESVGLRGRDQSFPNQLSGGQQQRVAIARSLAMRPQIILADEPTGNLDSEVSEEVIKTISELNKRDGITVVVVTHEPDIAAFARRLISFKDGRVVYDGPVKGGGKP
jgi:ABC-type lipoprotein export system ATPase subunit